MTKSSSEPPPSASDQPVDGDTPVQPSRPQTAEEIRRGVLRQRKHIQALDGEDPLRGGVAD